MVPASNDLFQTDETGRVSIYVDGSCSRNGRPDAVAGIGVWFSEFNPLNTSKTLKEAKTTNIVAEILAAIEACRIAIEFGLDRIKIITDSQYLISAITEYLPKWEANGWMNAKSKPVKNQVLLRRLSGILRTIDAIFEHSPGHQGLQGNEEADKLAKIGARILKPHKSYRQCIRISQTPILLRREPNEIYPAGTANLI